jgi:ElaA protein
MKLQWILKRFEELTPLQVYHILQLRNEVFVVEQNCVFQDADDKDQGSYHFLGYAEDRLAAYTRLVPPGYIYTETSIGRVVTAPFVRRSGSGRELMIRSIEHAYALFGKGPIKIGAQFYLKQFYESFGFMQTSAIYLEDGIEHIYMIKNM